MRAQIDQAEVALRYCDTYRLSLQDDLPVIRIAEWH